MSKREILQLICLLMKNHDQDVLLFTRFQLQTCALLQHPKVHKLQICGMDSPHLKNVFVLTSVLALRARSSLSPSMSCRLTLVCAFVHSENLVDEAEGSRSASQKRQPQPYPVPTLGSDHQPKDRGKSCTVTSRKNSD